MNEPIIEGDNRGLRVADAVCVDDAELLFTEPNPEENRRLSEFDR